MLDGWDDFNGNQLVDYASECLTLSASDARAAYARGGLQMAERALSGELGSDCASMDSGVDSGVCDLGSPGRAYTPDRESDCVPELSDVGLPSALANQVTFSRP